MSIQDLTPGYGEQLGALFGLLPESDLTFIKMDVSPAAVADLPDAQDRRWVDIDEAGTVNGIAALLTLTGWSDHVAELCLVVDPAARGTRHRPQSRTARDRGLPVIGSPGHPLDEVALAARAHESFRRANDPADVARQLAAIHASGDRTERLRRLGVPTLVLHGEGTRSATRDVAPHHRRDHRPRRARLSPSIRNR